MSEMSRRLEQYIINRHPTKRDVLEQRYGVDNVWNTDELTSAFYIHSFLAPYCVVVRKSDGSKGTVRFQHSPRFYFDFIEDRRG